MKLLAAILLCFSLSAQAEVVSLPKDKQGHIVLGVGVYAGCRILRYEPETCLYAAMAVGVAKEAMDATDKKHHSVEFMDFAATATGGLLMFTFERSF